MITGKTEVEFPNWVIVVYYFGKSNFLQVLISCLICNYEGYEGVKEIETINF